MASVSVIIATYNRAGFLPEALASITSQTHPVKEILIVDDGSTDNTEIIAARSGSLVRYFKTAHLGRPAALNFALPHACGSHIWLFDDDDVALPNAVEFHLDYQITHPDIDLTYSTNYVYRGNGNIWQREKWIEKYIPDWPPETFLLHTLESMNTLLPGMLIPKHCLLKTGPFETTLLRAQDHDMLLRLAMRYKSGNIMKPTFVLREHNPGAGVILATHPTKKEKTQLRYQQSIFRKIRNEQPLWTYLPHLPGVPAPELTSMNRGMAILQRYCIMLRQGLVSEAMIDLADALDILDVGKLIQSEAQILISRSIDIEPWVLAHPYATVRRLYDVIMVHRAEELLLSVARGIYWTFRRSLRRRYWRNTVIAGVMLITIIYHLASARLDRFFRNLLYGFRIS